jgi:hypothetical protein
LDFDGRTLIGLLLGGVCPTRCGPQEEKAALLHSPMASLVGKLLT